MTRGLATLLAGLALGAAPAEAQSPPKRPASDPFARARAEYVAATDDPRVLARMAGAATSAGELDRFRAVLDSVVTAGAGHPNAVQYWAALALRGGAPLARVEAELEEYRASAPADVAGIVGLVRVLRAHNAIAAAQRLADRAIAGGIAPEGLIVQRGELRLAAGDPVGALELWLSGVAVGGGTAVAAAAAIEGLLDRWPADSPINRAVDALSRARASSDGASRGLLVPLLVRADVAAGAWEAAIDAAGDPAIDLETRGQQLRQIAAAAAAAAPDAARSALEALLALGPPAARDEDRLRLAELAAALGEHGAAAEALRSAAAQGVEGAGPAARLAEVAAARDAGDRAGIEAALERARGAGIPADRIAVPWGDVLLARGARDSALSAYAEGVGDRPAGAAALEALARVRLVQALVLAEAERELVGEIGVTLVGAPAGPAAAAERLAGLAEEVGKGDSLATARSLLLGLAGEWRGRAGDAAGASAALEAAAVRPGAAGEAPPLLLAAGRWAAAAGDRERARSLWRALVERHGETPYALEARRLLAAEPARS